MAKLKSSRHLVAGEKIKLQRQNYSENWNAETGKETHIDTLGISILKLIGTGQFPSENHTSSP